MFQVYSVAGRTFSGSLDQLRLTTAPVNQVVPVRPVRVDPTGVEQQGTARLVGRAARAMAAYEADNERHRLHSVADVMHRPAHTVAARTPLREAWQLLARHRIGQAPVVNDGGALVGLIGRAELMPPDVLADTASDRAQWLAWLDQPVAQVMWSPIVSTAPATDLRQLAALLLSTGLPGVPVTDDAGQVLGFVSRSDLLRALAVDPPLDLWG